MKKTAQKQKNTPLSMSKLQKVFVTKTEFKKSQKDIQREFGKVHTSLVSVEETTTHLVHTMSRLEHRMDSFEHVMNLMRNDVATRLDAVMSTLTTVRQEQIIGFHLYDERLDKHEHWIHTIARETDVKIS
ncbi:hypothetical protein A2997_02085 [Candidatus Nomurabacteria bacterium RIFCSPLOWO2_01_FULL_36_10b]|uniref:Uncharacterized protein n=1 Tax=Candidatus Nomurabacteria bacterium RIFCSPLOWO2_01_FULL_36_10b TaxID=1801766 RepID=A0A1F6WPA5_9BACT|nr:MAG: hypothetical protein A2997_02085 [Candidatus Nomurabacteria bacterium RIFCSPLOWO2_01_FULL_36_10b]